MIANAIRIREAYQQMGKTGAGRRNFINWFRHGLGLCDANGNNHKDRAGNRVLKEQKHRPELFSVQEIAEGLVGPDWRRFYNPEDRGSLVQAQQHALLTADQYPGDTQALFEATGQAIDPSAFLNINATSLAIGGLIEAKMLEKFQDPEFIGEQLMPAEPTKVNGQKIIGVNPIGDKAKARRPGEPHARSQFGERWVQTPETEERALACEVTKEAIFFDLTGQVLQMAGSVGEELGYNRELRIIAAFIGVGQGAAPYGFNWKGTYYSHYVTSRTLGYLNKQTNDMLDWTAFQASYLLSQRQVDPDTSKRILVALDTVLVNPAKRGTAELIVRANETETRTAGSDTQATAANLQIRRTPGSAPFTQGVTILTSPLVEQMCTAAAADGGLALSQANADKNWWHFNRSKFAKYMQNWPLTIQQAPPSTYDMIDRGIAAAWFANERGNPSIWSPWHAVHNTH